jgi:hypothetical protein
LKFLTDLDAKLFLLEIGELEKISSVTRDYTPTNEELTSFIKKRREEGGALKDHDKSRKAKEGWRKNRADRMRGIRSFHKSTEGKRFHKRLGRFLASRISSNNEDTDNEVLEYLKGLCAAKNTLFTELEFYHPLTEQFELDSIVMDYALPMFGIIESKVVRKQALSEDEFDFLLDITETAEVVRALANKSGKRESEVEKAWDEIKASLLKQNNKESDPQFYGLLVSILKKKLNLT